MDGIVYPSEEWAQRVFPNDKDAYDKLSQLIAKAMRLDTPNPQKAWQEHQELLQSRVWIISIRPISKR